MTIVDGSFDFVIKEADLFAAVQRWAVKECERKEMEINGGNLRQVRLSFSSLLFLFIAYISTSLNNKKMLHAKLISVSDGSCKPHPVFDDDSGGI